MTTFSDVITNNALIEISDVRLNEELEQNPAAFMWKMAAYLKDGIPLFKHPAEAKGWLGYTDAAYTQGTWDIDPETPTPYTLQGEIGYDIACATSVSYDKFNNPIFTPLTCEYDSETGVITVQDAIESGAHIEVDYYTDGVFDNDLTDDIKRILGLCVQYVWTSRFVNDYVLQSPKVHDKDFNISSEANYNRAETERLNRLRNHLYDEQRSFEQNLRYGQTVPNAKQLIMPTE